MKRGIAISFSWIFAIVVGAIILFLAVFIAMNFIGIGEREQSTKTAQIIVNLLDPLQTGAEDGRIARPITLLMDTRILTTCNEVGVFGENRIQIQERSSFRGDWARGGNIPATKNQYVFADNIIEGKELRFFIKPFNMPFKVADMMMLYTKDYCFVNAPSDIREEISLLGSGTINATSSIRECKDGSIKVCFSNMQNCDVVVNQNCQNNICSGRVSKNGTSVNFYGDLVYPAIFASVENYNCGVNRLMMRLDKLSELYVKKAQFSSGRCNTALVPNLVTLNSAAKSKNLNSVVNIAEEIERINRGAVCRLY